MSSDSEFVVYYQPQSKACVRLFNMCREYQDELKTVVSFQNIGDLDADVLRENSSWLNQVPTIVEVNTHNVFVGEQAFSTIEQYAKRLKEEFNFPPPDVGGVGGLADQNRHHRGDRVMEEFSREHDHFQQQKEDDDDEPVQQGGIFRPPKIGSGLAALYGNVSFTADKSKYSDDAKKITQSDMEKYNQRREMSLQNKKQTMGNSQQRR